MEKHAEKSNVRKRVFKEEENYGVGGCEDVLTFTLLGDGHAEPVHVQTVLAADAGGAAAKRMERDGPHDQWKLQRQL